jgi:hypothetical protein
VLIKNWLATGYRFTNGVWKPLEKGGEEDSICFAVFIIFGLSLEYGS